MFDKAKHIIVVGGGAAGLTAARMLLKQGQGVTVLEANNRLGGRIHTIREPFEKPVEKGFEFVHGDLPLTLELLKEAGIDHQAVKGTMSRVENGEWKTQQDFTIGWDECIRRMNEIKKDLTIDEFLQKNFGDEKYKDLKTSVLRFAEGFDLADTSKASVLAIREEWMAEEEEQYHVVGGCDQLIKYLAQQLAQLGGEIHTSSNVTGIEWKKNDVKIIVKSGTIYEGAKVVITVPLGVLQSDPASLDFHPAIPGYLGAARQIGFGSVVKILLQFRVPFWEEKKKNLGFLFANTTVPTWWTALPSSHALLTGWVGGPQARHLENKDDKSILELALLSLSNIFKKSVADLNDLLSASCVANWRNDPFTLGGYSYPMVESAKAQKIFSTPIEDTIFFAGEAFYEGPSPGTLEAALVSARNVVEKVMNSE